jgi:hypothetical protein
VAVAEVIVSVRSATLLVIDHVMRWSPSEHTVSPLKMEWCAQAGRAVAIAMAVNAIVATITLTVFLRREETCPKRALRPIVCLPRRPKRAMYPFPTSERTTARNRATTQGDDSRTQHADAQDTPRRSSLSRIALPTTYATGDQNSVIATERVFRAAEFLVRGGLPVRFELGEVGRASGRSAYAIAPTPTIGTAGGDDPSEPTNGLFEKAKMPPSDPTIR